jgi:hypothetical protein
VQNATFLLSWGSRKVRCVGFEILASQTIVIAPCLAAGNADLTGAAAVRPRDQNATALEFARDVLC